MDEYFLPLGGDVICHLADDKGVSLPKQKSYKGDATKSKIILLWSNHLSSEFGYIITDLIKSFYSNIHLAA